MFDTMCAKVIKVDRTLPMWLPFFTKFRLLGHFSFLYHTVCIPLGCQQSACRGMAKTFILIRSRMIPLRSVQQMF